MEEPQAAEALAGAGEPAEELAAAVEEPAVGVGEPVVGVGEPVAAVGEPVAERVAAAEPVVVVPLPTSIGMH